MICTYAYVLFDLVVITLHACASNWFCLSVMSLLEYLAGFSHF